MTNLTKLQSTATALVGALLLSTAFVTAAVGPAAVVERAPVSAQAQA